MKNMFFYVLVFAFLTACNSESANTVSDAENETNETVNTNTGDLKTDIEALKSFFAAHKSNELDKMKANEMVEKCQQFAIDFPNDPAGGGYLFTGGEVARSLNRYEDAINMFTKVETNYPDHDRAPMASFMKAFTYEENLHNSEMAKKYYESFLAKYPDHELAAQVKELIAVIGLSPEEMIKRFKAKNK